MKLKFKTDENIPIEVSELLNLSGHDSETVYDENLNGQPDAIISNKCRSENRILITLDLDFSNILNYPPDKFPGFIVLRVQNQSKNNIVKLIKKILPFINAEDLLNHLWIISENKIRIHGNDNKSNI